MNELGKFLVVIGLLLVAVGALVWSGLGRGWLGRLPGDIHLEGQGYRFDFPVVTCILVSVVLSLLLWVVQMLRK